MIRKKTVLCIILARGGSKGIKNKNIKKLNGIPLILYTLNATKKSRYIDKTIVSSDSKKIINLVKKNKYEAPFVRPKKLSRDSSNNNDAFIHALKWIEKKEEIKYDYILQLQCTNPFVSSTDIDKVIQKLHYTQADSVISMCKINSYHPSRIKKIVKDRIQDFAVKEKPFSNRQSLKPYAYVRNGGLYACLRRSINYRVGSKNSRPYIMPTNKSINIDNEIDFKIAEILIKELKKKKI